MIPNISENVDAIRDLDPSSDAMDAIPGDIARDVFAL